MGASSTPGAAGLFARRLENFIVQLRNTASATATLEAWCASHGRPGQVSATLLAGPDGAVDDAVRQRLGVAADADVQHRDVQLQLGGFLLSRASNWFAPMRLPPAMRRALAETDAPFGRVIASLSPVRTVLSEARLWTPDQGAVDAGAPVYRLRAMVSAPLDGALTPLAEVDETYVMGALAPDLF